MWWRPIRTRYQPYDDAAPGPRQSAVCRLLSAFAAKLLQRRPRIPRDRQSSGLRMRDFLSGENRPLGEFLVIHISAASTAHSDRAGAICIKAYSGHAVDADRRIGCHPAFYQAMRNNAVKKNAYIHRTSNGWAECRAGTPQDCGYVRKSLQRQLPSGGAQV